MQEILAFLAPTLALVAVVAVTLGVGLLVEWVGQREQNARGFAWVRCAAETLRTTSKRLWRWILHRDRKPSVIIYTSAAALAALGFASFGSENAIMADLAPEMVSTALAISVVDWLFNYRSEQREKKRVIIQMGSSDSNDVALAALAVARAEGWLNDGTLNGCNFMRANLKGANLGAANLKGSGLWGTNLEGANLWKACLEGAVLWEANLEGAYLRSAHFEDAFLNDANLKGADLRRANLEGADLRGANLAGVMYSKETGWPDGFDPRSAGAILVDDNGNPINVE